jgi:hypothetical protein
MDNGHRERPVRNFFYTLWCVFTAAAFTVASYVLYYNPRYKEVILTGCISVIVISLLLGVISPLFKTIFKR